MTSAYAPLRVIALTTVLFTGICAQGCAAPATSASPDEEASSASSAIKGGTLATVYDLAPHYVVRIGEKCTGTIVGPRHILTAAHCFITSGRPVYFYKGFAPEPVASRTVSNAWVPTGVDSVFMKDGYLCDIALIVLNSDIDLSQYWVAELPTASTASMRYMVNAVVWPVGRGAHDGMANPGNFLKWNTAHLSWFPWYAAPNASVVQLQTIATDAGDSGGPLFVNGIAPGSLMTIGVLSGTSKNGKGSEDEYSNTYRWSNWINEQINATL